MVCRLAEGQRFCGIECDGGTVLVRPYTARSADGLMLRNHGFLIRGHCADEGELGASLDADFGGDDVFALDPVSAADCAAISGVR